MPTKPYAPGGSILIETMAVNKGVDKLAALVWTTCVFAHGYAAAQVAELPQVCEVVQDDLQLP